MTQIKSVDILILGAGWTATFLLPLLDSSNITYAATSTTGRADTIKFIFDPDSNEQKPYNALPNATTILIVFPLKGKGQSTTLVSLYEKTHPNAAANFVQLGSTGIFTATHWTTETSSYDKTSTRAIAEDELMTQHKGATLNLAGLWGGTRDPRHWANRVAKSKEQLATKKSLHLIHGEDVARGIVAMHRRFTPGKRWLLTDLCVYDWYDLAYRWEEFTQRVYAEQGEAKLEYRKWVAELMLEEDVRALPRNTGVLGRCLDSRAFWKEMGVLPGRTLFR